MTSALANARPSKEPETPSGGVGAVPPDARRGPTPYFSTPMTGPLARRRILLLSYHFVPGAAAGTLRWQKFASLFAEHGYGLDVVALAPEQIVGNDFIGGGTAIDTHGGLFYYGGGLGMELKF